MLNKWFIFRFNWGDTLGCDFKRCLRKSSLLLDDLLRRRAWRRPWRVCGQQRRRPTIFSRVRIQWQLMSDYSSSHGSGSSSNTSASSDSGDLGSAHSDAVSGIATVVSIGTTASSNASRAVISTASGWAWAVVRVASWLASWKWTIITIPGVSLMKNSRTILSQKETYVLQADHWNFLIMI